MASELGCKAFTWQSAYIVSFKELSPIHSTIHQLGLVGVGSDPTSDTINK